MKRFSAPWGKTLVWMSGLSVVLIVVVMGLISLDTHSKLFFGLPGFAWLFLVLLLSTILITALFTIRGYTVTPDAILVHRVFWDTRLFREGLISATVEPEAMNWSLRVCGNGGMFSITGWYWSKRLGRFRAYVTDPNLTVVLRFEKRTVVVSPGEPYAFVRELMG